MHYNDTVLYAKPNYTFIEPDIRDEDAAWLIRHKRKPGKPKKKSQD